MQSDGLANDLWIVVIGRNEGERLTLCLDSLSAWKDKIVYVDSGSTDNSTRIAQPRVARVIELDSASLFTAARARNEGVSTLQLFQSNAKYVQFIDGDCTLHPAWLNKAQRFLAAHEDVAVVCGRRRERDSKRSIYNQLCDIEWDTPVGQAQACGGDALFRLAAFEQAGGFRANLIAGEEPELCARIRANGWKIWRIDAEMTLHDAAMTAFGQWWRRAVRSGYADAEVSFTPACRQFSQSQMRRVVSAVIWGAVIPLIIFFGSCFSPLTLVLLALYPLQVIRVALKKPARFREEWLYAFFITIAKFAEITGIFRYFIMRYRGSSSSLIEYKNVARKSSN